MRGSWILVAALLLASGCADQPALPDDGDATAEGAFVEPSDVPNGVPPAMKFQAGEFDETVSYEGSFRGQDPCIQSECAQILEFDLTPQVPVDAPVELTATTTTDADCFQVTLRIEDGDSVSEVRATDQVSSRIVRTATSVVTLRARHCTPSTDVESATVPISIEVRTAVRPTVLPTRVPVSVELAAGDRLLGMGDDLEQLVVYPPGQAPVRLEDPFEFNATVAGTHVVAAIGTGDAMLHGPDVPMVALPILTTVGEPHALSAGETSWDVEVPGIPVSITLELATQDAPGPYYRGNANLLASQAGVAFFEVREAGCLTPVCSVGPGAPLSTSWARYGSGVFPDGIGLGPITFTVSSAQIMGYQAVETVSWVAA